MNVDYERRQWAVSGILQFGTQPRSWLSLSLILGALGFGILGSPRSAHAANAPVILIRVSNYAQVPSGNLKAAEREAGRIFSAAGLMTEWVNCPSKGSATDTPNPCSQPLQPHEIVLRLISESTSAQFQDSVFGFAVVPLVASVYVNCAVRNAKKDNAEFEMPMILGSVIAHEIGHLLLGLNSHSPTGIMQQRWERNQLRQVVTGNMMFTVTQGKLMQADMQRRISVQTAVNP
jgi:hypothetical protein